VGEGNRQHCNIAILSPKNEDFTEINERKMNTLIQDDSRTCHIVDAVECEDRWGEQRYAMELLNSLSP
jgi:hypothetical protein